MSWKRTQLGIPTGLKYPQSQSVGGGYACSRSSINTLPLSNLPDNVLQDVDRTNGVWNASFDVGWEADVWGKFRRGVEAADVNLAANMLNYDAVLVTLTGDVAAMYTSIRTLQERLDYIYTNVNLQRQALDLANSRFKLGATWELDVEQAKELLGFYFESPTGFGLVHHSCSYRRTKMPESMPVPSQTSPIFVSLIPAHGQMFPPVQHGQSE